MRLSIGSKMPHTENGYELLIVLFLLLDSLQMLQEAFSYNVKNEEPVRKKSSPASKPQETKSYQPEAMEGNEFGE